ncbi:MAG: hypothetical protein GSR80_001168 [Desulfurococcales archaeon]|nr:hypothetical protein [Desulfurococcales archaeon]
MTLTTTTKEGCTPGALMAAASLLAVQGFTLLLAAMLQAPAAAASTTLGIAGIPLATIALAAIGVAEVAATAALAAGYRSGGPLGAASAGFLIALEGLAPPSQAGTPRQQATQALLATLIIALLAAGWACTPKPAPGKEQPTASRPEPREAPGRTGGPQAPQASGEA